MPNDQQQQLQLRVTLDDQASAGLAKLREELSTIGANVQGVMGKFQSRNQDMGKELKELGKEASRGMEGLNKYIGKFGVAGAAMASTAATIAVGLKSLGEFASKIQEISNKAKVIGMSPADLRQISEQYEKVGVSANVVVSSLGGMVQTLSELARPETGKLTEMVQAAGAYGPVMLDAIRRVQQQTTESGQLNEILLQRQNVYDNVLHQQGGTREKAAQAANRFMQLWKLDPVLGVVNAINALTAEQIKRFNEQQKATEQFRNVTFEIGKEWEKFTEDLSTSALSADGVIVHGLQLANVLLKELHANWQAIFNSPYAKAFVAALSPITSPISAANQIYNKLQSAPQTGPAGPARDTPWSNAPNEPSVSDQATRAKDFWKTKKDEGVSPAKFADMIPDARKGKGGGQRKSSGTREPFAHFDEWLADQPAVPIEDRRDETRSAVADIKDDYLKGLNENTVEVKKLNDYFKLLTEGDERGGLGGLLGRGGKGGAGWGGGGGGGGPNGSDVGPGNGPGANQSTSPNSPKSTSPNSPTTADSKPTEPQGPRTTYDASGVQGLPGTQSGPAPGGTREAPPVNAAGVPGLAGSPSGPPAVRAAPPQSPASPGGGTSPNESDLTGGIGSRISMGGAGPASIRYNNPGAQYPSPNAMQLFSSKGYGIIGGGHQIAAFPDFEHGAASNMDLFYRKYTGMNLGAAGKKWTGSYGFGVPGYDPKLVVTKDMMKDEKFAIPLMKAIAAREAGTKLPWTDDQWKAAYQIFRSGGKTVTGATAGGSPRAGAPVGQNEGGILPGDDPGRGGPGAHGGRFNYPAGTRIQQSELETITLSNGQKVTVNKRAAGQFKGFFNDLIAAGAPVSRLGGPGTRGNPSQHPGALAVDWAQHSRDVVDPDVRRFIDGHPELMAALERRWGMSGGQTWRSKDTGHESIDVLFGPEHLKQAQLASAGGGQPTADRAAVDAASAPKSVRTIKVTAGGTLTADVNAPPNTSVKVEGSGGFKSTETNRTMPMGKGGSGGKSGSPTSSSTAPTSSTSPRPYTPENTTAAGPAPG